MIQLEEKVVRVCCPVCGSRIADRMKRYEVEVRRLYGNAEPDWEPDLIEKCQKCKSMIGIKRI